MPSELLGGETADPAELIAAAEARLDAARRSGATPPPRTAVVSSAAKQPKTGRKKKAAAQSSSVSEALTAKVSKPAKATKAKRPAAKRQPKPAASAQPSSVATKQPAKRKAAKPKAKAKRVERETVIPADAMEHLEREDPPLRLGLWGWVAVVSLVAVLTTGAVSNLRAPTPITTAEYAFVSTDGRHPPALLARQWLQRFGAGEGNLRNEPDRELLLRFAEHLREQPAIERVDDIHLIWDRDRMGDPRRVLRIVMQLRQPVLPVMLESGDQVWVDHEGRLLPGLIQGPEGLPVIRGWRQGTSPALLEVLEFWPQLQAALVADGASGLIRQIHLDRPYHRRADQSGIVLETTDGTLIEWGAPGDARYGVGTDRKLAMFRYELQLHGDLSRVAVINLRFHQPTHVMRAPGTS